MLDLAEIGCRNADPFGEIGLPDAPFGAKLAQAGACKDALAAHEPSPFLRRMTTLQNATLQLCKFAFA
jgi:hypothetical protein